MVSVPCLMSKLVQLKTIKMMSYLSMETCLVIFLVFLQTKPTNIVRGALNHLYGVK